MCLVNYDLPHQSLHCHLKSGLVSGLAGGVEGDVSNLACLRHNEDLHWLRHLLMTSKKSICTTKKNEKNLSASEDSSVHERPAL